MPANLENSGVATALKVVFIPIPKKGNAEECSNYHTIALILHANKVILKILQTRFQQHVNWELPTIQAGFRKGRGTRDQVGNIHWIIEKAREFQKKTSPSLTMLKRFDSVDRNKLWKILKQIGIPEHLTCLLRNLKACQEETELDIEQWTCSKLGKEYDKAICCHYIYLTYVQNTSCKMLGWMKHKLESIAGRNINNLRYADDTILMAEIEEKLKSLLMKVKEHSEKTGLKLCIQKSKNVASSPITSWQIDGKKLKAVIDLIFGGSKNHCKL